MIQTSKAAISDRTGMGFTANVHHSDPQMVEVVARYDAAERDVGMLCSAHLLPKPSQVADAVDASPARSSGISW
jgi:hypothetical protein